MVGAHCKTRVELKKFTYTKLYFLSYTNFILIYPIDNSYKTRTVELKKPICTKFYLLSYEKHIYNSSSSFISSPLKNHIKKKNLVK